MPLEPSPHRLLRPFFEGVHVIRQKEALRQSLGNAAPFTFLPHPHTSVCRKWLAVQKELRLPRLRGLGGGCYFRLDLGLRLLDNNAAGWSGRSPGCCISRARRHLLGNPLPLPNLSGLRRRWRRRRLNLGLRGWLLHDLPRTEHEIVYGYSPPVHHVFAKEGLSI